LGSGLGSRVSSEGTGGADVDDVGRFYVDDGNGLGAGRREEHAKWVEILEEPDKEKAHKMVKSLKGENWYLKNSSVIVRVMGDAVEVRDEGEVRWAEYVNTRVEEGETELKAAHETWKDGGVLQFKTGRYLMADGKKLTSVSVFKHPIKTD
jgi:hypothetical protein